ncbi:MAG TPA: restriction endonuclease [Deltaproteobacteria bacterium]|jgi:restriction system protein|nr:restriction endonuclease [Deltaproteobacteria bacterium]
MFFKLVWFILLGSLYSFFALILFPTSPLLAAVIIAIAFLHLLFRGILPKLVRIRRARRVRKAIASMIDEHLHALARRRRELIEIDHYGLVHLEEWEDEKDFFISNVLGSRFGNILSEDFPVPYFLIDIMIDKRIDAYFKRGHAGGTIREYQGEDWENADQQTYLGYCMKLLELAGWKVVIPTQEDIRNRGPILARKDGKLLLAACIRASKPLGRSFIRQTAAARLNHDADDAAIITNAGFSRWARSSALKHDVMLLHHSDLANID